MKDTILPKCVMFQELVEGAGCGGGQGKEWMRCFLNNPELSLSTLTSGRLQLRKRENGARRRNKGRNVSRHNASLERKPGQDYDIQ